MYIPLYFHVLITDNFDFMRNFILLLTACTFALCVSAQQVPKKPLIEHFTQASCGPCASQNPTMYNTLGTFGAANYVKLTYQTSWPGFDPMHLAYPAGPNDRRAIHGVTGVPNAVLNGGPTGAPNTVVTSATLNTASMQMSDLEMMASHTYMTGRDVMVEVTIKHVGATAITAGKRLISALTEKEIIYPTAPGTNGETEFFYVVRDMYNASTGASATTGFTLPAMNPGDSITYSFTTTTPSYIRSFGEIGFAFFVEDGAGGNVLQSTYSEPVAIPNALDVSTTAGNFAGATTDYCDNTLTPGFSFTNEEATPITSIEASYTIDGGTPVPATVSGLTVAQGQSAAVVFPAITLPVGSANIVYNIVSLNGGSPQATVNNDLGLAGSRIVMSATAVDTGIISAFDASAVGAASPDNAIADNPDGIRAYKVDNSITPDVTWNLGGFGNSNGCFRWDFFAIATGSSRIIYEKIDMTAAGANMAWLTWSTAYAQYSNENDRLEVLVSTDCGATWTNLYNVAGAALATAPVHGQALGRFYPEVTEWRRDSVDLSPYLTSTELMIAFKGTSAYGNSLYLDDINTEFIWYDQRQQNSSANN